MANRKKEIYKPKPMTEGKRNLIQNHRRPFIMANRKKEIYKPKPMTEGKRNLIQGHR